MCRVQTQHPGEQTQNTQTDRLTDYYNQGAAARRELIIIILLYCRFSTSTYIYMYIFACAPLFIQTMLYVIIIIIMLSVIHLKNVRCMSIMQDVTQLRVMWITGCLYRETWASICIHCLFFVWILHEIMFLMSALLLCTWVGAKKTSPTLLYNQN